jgi:serine/threonine protein kinase
MALKSGDRVGAFEIRGSLGAGGMGEVWRARDTRLHRYVALKLLPDAFAQDPDPSTMLRARGRGTTTVSPVSSARPAHSPP